MCFWYGVCYETQGGGGGLCIYVCFSLCTLFVFIHTFSYTHPTPTHTHTQPQPTQLEPFPNIASGANAFLSAPLHNVPADAYTRMEGTYIRPIPLQELAAAATGVIMDHAKHLYAQDPSRGNVTVVLDLPCTFFAIQTPRCGVSVYIVLYTVCILCYVLCCVLCYILYVYCVTYCMCTVLHTVLACMF